MIRIDREKSNVKKNEGSKQTKNSGKSLAKQDNEVVRGKLVDHTNSNGQMVKLAIPLSELRADNPKIPQNVRRDLQLAEQKAKLRAMGELLSGLLWEKGKRKKMGGEEKPRQFLSVSSNPL